MSKNIDVSKSHKAYRLHVLHIVKHALCQHLYVYLLPYGAVASRFAVHFCIKFL